MLKTLADFLGLPINVVWTAVFVILRWYFRDKIGPMLQKLLDSGSFEARFGPEGFSLTVEGAAKATAILTAKFAKQLNRPLTEEETLQIADTAAEGAQLLATEGKVSVLWVDDNPNNNRYAISALRDLGFTVVTRESTESALEDPQLKQYAVVVTDQMRVEKGHENPQAADELIKGLKARHIVTPVILSTAWPNQEQARNKGFYGASNTQHDAIRLITQAIREKNSVTGDSRTGPQ